MHWGWEDEDQSVASANLELLGHFATGPLQHTLLIGADYYDEDYDSGGWAWGGTPTLSNIHAPDYTSAYHDDYPADPYGYKNRNEGVYAQDQVAFAERWHVMLGVRHDNARYDNNYAGSTLLAEDSALTWRGGVLYQPRPDLSVYASFVEGFGSSNFDWTTGTAFDPQTSYQYEVGAKWQPSSRFGLSIALFQLVKDNLTMADPENPLRTILAGEATSEGIELDVSGQITDAWSVVASYAYTDVRYTKSDSMQGERMFGVPRNGASFWTTYRLGGTGLQFGGGVVYRDSQLGTQRAWDPAIYPYTLNGYTLIDLMASYAFDLAGNPTKVQLNISNATDERYNPSSYGGMSRIMLGEPRMILGSFRMSF